MSKKGLRNTVVTGLLLAAAAATPPLFRSWHDHRDAMHLVVAAADTLPYRPIAPRVTGGFAYRPFRAATRSAGSGGTGDGSQWQLYATAAQLAQPSQQPVSNQRALSVTLLLLGRPESAVGRLERLVLQETAAAELSAALGSSRDADLLNDLAAAYLNRNTTVAHDTLLAAETSERAWLIQQRPEIAWNRALAREALHVRSQAMLAWNDVLRIESDPGWRAEALDHLRRLRAPPQSRRWLAARALLEQRQPGEGLIGTIVADFPQETRDYTEGTLLAEWAEARTDEPLRVAKMIGAALAAITGEHLSSDTIAVITGADDASRHRLMAAHAQYAHGRALMNAQQMGAAAQELNQAERLLAIDQSPFALRAALYAATAEYNEGHLDLAMDHLARTEEAMARRVDRYPSLYGQIQWVTGLIESSRGHNNEALSAFKTALASFDKVREDENRLSIVILLAEVSRYIGQEQAAWSYQERGLRTLEQLGPVRRSHGVLSDAADAAGRAGLPLAALVFQNGLVSLRLTKPDPVLMSDALIARSNYEAAAGMQTASRTDLEEARRQLAAISDEGMRTRTLANLNTVEATVLRTFDPSRAGAAADLALAEMNRLGHHAPVAALELEAGRAFARLHRDDEAMKRWRAGIAECETQRTALPVRDYQRTYFEQCRALFDESIGLLAHAGRFRDALSLAEETRARGLLDVLAPGNAAPVADALNVIMPSGVTAVEYMLLPNAVVAWTIDVNGITGAVWPLNRRQLHAGIERLLAPEADPNAAAEIFDVLVRPVASRLAEHVVFIPDGDAYRVPFASIVDRRTRHFFVQDHEVSVAPSLALLTRPGGTAAAPSSRTLLIDAGAVENPYRPDAVRLPAAGQEIADLAALYPKATVISGAACTRAKVMTALQSAELIHFTGHATSGSADDDPALVVRPADHDHGLLYPADIAALPLGHADLVILGACGTADGRIGSEGPLSIARAFLAAGAHRIVATLWPVDDYATREILTRFHKNLLADAAPARALREAQLEAIRSSKSARDWAAFEVIESHN